MRAVFVTQFTLALSAVRRAKCVTPLGDFEKTAQMADRRVIASGLERTRPSAPIR
jgi:hypothetical protein